MQQQQASAAFRAPGVVSPFLQRLHSLTTATAAAAVPVAQALSGPTVNSAELSLSAIFAGGLGLPAELQQMLSAQAASRRCNSSSKKTRRR